MVWAIVSMSTCVAQKIVSVEELKHGVWNRYCVSQDEGDCITFTDTVFTRTYCERSTGEWLCATHSSPYYLSSKIPTAFDFSKVGKNTKGKYLIRWNYKMNKFHCTEIDSLTDSLLVFKYSWGSDRFRRAPTFRCTVAEKEVWDKHSDEIQSKTSYRAAEEFERICQHYYVPKEKKTLIEGYVRDREFHKVCLEYMLPDSLKLRVMRKIRIDEHYQDSIDRVLIPEYTNKISGYNISFALHFCRKIHLDSAQFEYLLVKALDMTHRIRKDRTLNVWNEEMDLLGKTLDKKQLDRFFTIKNGISVSKEARQAWKRICDAGLENEVDSAREMNLAISYYHERQKIKDIYRYHGTQQKKYLSELSKKMPLIVRMVDALDKKERMEEDEKKNGTIGKEFVW